LKFRAMRNSVLFLRRVSRLGFDLIHFKGKL